MRASLMPCVGLGLMLAGIAKGEPVTVVVGVDPAKGPVMLGLFDRANLFDRAPDSQDQAVLALRPTPAGSTVSVVLDGLPHGRYAAALYQDSDRDGKLDSNFLGIPTEPYGFSGPGGSGRPDFEAAAGTGTLRVRLRD